MLQLQFVLHTFTENMWPFESAPEVAVENKISNHDVVGYNIDASFGVLVCNFL